MGLIWTYGGNTFHGTALLLLSPSFSFNPLFHESKENFILLFQLFLLFARQDKQKSDIKKFISGDSRVQVLKGERDQHCAYLYPEPRTRQF